MRCALPIALLLLLGSCTKENFYTEQELNHLSVLEPGTTYILANTEGDTLSVHVSDSRVYNNADKNGRFSKTRYNEYWYYLTPKLNGVHTRRAFWYAESRATNRTELRFGFNVHEFSTAGFIETSHMHDTATVNGRFYNDVFRHHEGTIISAEHGLLRVGLHHGNEFVAYER